MMSEDACLEFPWLRTKCDEGGNLISVNESEEEVRDGGQVGDS